MLVGFNHPNVDKRYDILDLVETRLYRLFNQKQCDFHDSSVVLHECSTHQIGSKLLIDEVSENLFLHVDTTFKQHRKEKKIDLSSQLMDFYSSIISLHLIRPDPQASHNTAMRQLVNMTMDILKRNPRALNYSEMYLLRSVVRAHDADVEEFQKHANEMNKWLN